MFLNCGQSPPLLRHSEVPPRVTENFILSGYRFPNYSLWQCLLSAIRPTNETGNFWTHFLPIFVFAYYFVEPFGWEGAPPGDHPFFYPLWNYSIGVFCLLMASSMAHLLNSMSLVIREVCFFVDYGTISAYTVGSSIAYHYYIHPRTGILEPGAGGHNASRAGWGGGPVPAGSWWFGAAPCVGAFFQAWYIPCSCAVALVCILSCCNTRQRWRTHRYAIRTLVFLLPFLVSSTPIFYRLLTGCPFPPGTPSAARSASLAHYFYRHCFWLLASAVFNISKVPERYSPGGFDIWGHSHQWFHCCTFLSILDELHMITGEVRALLLHPSPELPVGSPTLLSTYGVMLLLQATIASVITWFSWCANGIYGPEGERMAKERQSAHLKCH